MRLHNDRALNYELRTGLEVVVLCTGLKRVEERGFYDAMSRRLEHVGMNYHIQSLEGMTRLATWWHYRYWDMIGSARVVGRGEEISQYSFPEAAFELRYVPIIQPFVNVVIAGKRSTNSHDEEPGIVVWASEQS